MSGVSLAVAHPHHGSDHPDKTSTKTQQQEEATTGGMMGSLRWIELQLVAFVMVFSAIGLVPLFDLLFPAFTTAYLLILSRLAFPGATTCKEIVQGSGMLRGYAVVGTVIGLFLPLAYVLGGYARGDEEAVRSATPQLFLLSFQILTENVISGLSLFSAPVRALVPMLYTVRRLFVILDWIQDVLLNKSLNTDHAPIQDIAWYWFGISLAVTNLAYFSINIFAFLIPRFLPKAFEQYFKERNETQAKLAEDKHEQHKDKKFD
ncbi:hypothetical protein L6452_12758 [Arctium lappa]|uniref:Uncharacterized protein n=1 Tax=Arctium lappa TaxID=4217 RepID=A0ACB9CGE1_ARCLA|nr:hypothetical protein L6452_12758 [Arctium lappa]